MRRRPVIPGAARPAPRGRRAFTLVEVLVALVLLCCGALALVAASAMTIRSNAAAESQIAATYAARGRVEALAAGACAVPRDTSGVESSTTLREAWSVRVSGNGTRLVTDSVEYDDRSGRRALALHRLAVC